MTEHSRPLLVSLAGAVLLALAGVGLLRAVTQTQSRSPEDSNRMIDLLMQVSSQRANEPEPAAAPPPPRQTSWASPLHRQCPAVDRSVQKRLLAQQAHIHASSSLRRIDPSNYGQRYRLDAFGSPVDPTPRVIVLHETVYGLSSALNTFSTPHADDADQVSYHSLVGLGGELVRVVDPRMRAFGAGYSAFNNQWVITNPKVGGSINNFALHLSLETPEDGENEAGEHSGYTQAQYDTMAIELAHWMRTFSIPADHITTHRHVDLGGERGDPRSLDWGELAIRLRALGLLCAERGRG
jgi:N-acetylmuramoyl-L-alanine amidase